MGSKIVICSRIVLTLTRLLFWHLFLFANAKITASHCSRILYLVRKQFANALDPDHLAILRPE